MKRITLNIILVGLYLLLDAKVNTIPISYLKTNVNNTGDRFANEVTCPVPPQPDNGQWVLASGGDLPVDTILASTVLLYKCNPTHKLSQSSLVVCDADWNLENLPICEALCRPIRSIRSIITVKCHDKIGQEISCQEAAEGAYLEYTCAEFYKPPVGQKKVLTCIAGVWDDTDPVCELECGRKNEDYSVPLINNGRIATFIEYPWVVAVYEEENDTPIRNICGGSIISQTVVLTAAHCVTNDDAVIIPSKEYVVGAGKIYTKYLDPREKYAQYLKVNHIVVQSFYKADHRHYSADIALLITEKPFRINKWVQPVCLDGIENIILRPGKIGVISGWGYNEDGVLSDELRTLYIFHKYEPICAAELPRDWNNRYNMADKICDGFVNKNMSICMGDSGSGLVFKNPQDDRYYIHGVASLGVRDNSICNVNQNSLYTKVSVYYDFIKGQMKNYSTCFLPPYPENGKWVITDEREKKPGDPVSSNTVLKFICDEGYHISTGITAGRCDLDNMKHNMPICLLTCPRLEFPPSVDFECQDQSGDIINCRQAKENTTLTYTCPEGFKKPDGAKNSSKCIYGSWGEPSPSCSEVETSTEVTTKQMEDNHRKIIHAQYSLPKKILDNLNELATNRCTHAISKASPSLDGNLSRCDFTYSDLMYCILALIILLIILNLGCRFIIFMKGKFFRRAR